MLTRDRIGALLMLAFSIGYGVMIFRIPLLPFQMNDAFTARSMPQALAVLGCVLSLVVLFKPMSEADRTENARWLDAMKHLARPIAGQGFPLMRVLVLCGLMVFYGLTVRPLGFLVSTSLFLIAGMLVLGERRFVMVLLSSVSIVVFFWVLMTQFLGVYIAPLPEVLVDMFGG